MNWYSKTGDLINTDAPPSPGSPEAVESGQIIIIARSTASGRRWGMSEYKHFKPDYTGDETIEELQARIRELEAEVARWKSVAEIYGEEQVAMQEEIARLKKAGDAMVNFIDDFVKDRADCMDDACYWLEVKDNWNAARKGANGTADDGRHGEAD